MILITLSYCYNKYKLQIYKLVLKKINSYKEVIIMKKVKVIVDDKAYEYEVDENDLQLLLKLISVFSK
jgi:hypothetical protein